MLFDNVESRALLIHHHNETKNIDITTHGVIPVEGGGFTLGAGRAMTLADRDQLTAILLDEDRETQFIQEHILAASRSMICWYRKPGFAELPFSVSQKLSTIKAPLPGLIFVASAAAPLRCFAFKGNARPTPETKLFYAPLGNVYSKGTFCSGNTNVSRTLTLSNIPDWENFVLGAASTHMGDISPIKGIQRGELAPLVSFLEGLTAAGKKAFPVGKLVPVAQWSTRTEHIALSAVLNGEFK